MSTRVLVVEDEKTWRLCSGSIEREGFEVHEALDGNAALEASHTVDPDVVVLDWMLPGLDGMEVLRELRRFSEAYVIMLTARAEEVDRIVGLSTGADDYLTKPFSPGELIARIRAMLRRSRSEAREAEEDAPLRFGELTIDPARREVRLKEKRGVPHGPAVRPARHLGLAPGARLQPQALERVWGDDYFGSDHVVDVHIANLRKKVSRTRRILATSRPFAG